MRPESNSQKLLNDGKYLALLAATERDLRSARPDRVNLLGQMNAMYHAMCGDDVGARTAWDATFKTPSAYVPPSDVFPGARLLDARDEILKQARKHQVVVLNESHHISRHRAFGLSLLEGLCRLGFTYFAAETFAKPGVLQESLAHRVVTRRTGYYTVDPVFAAYVQKSLDLGFTSIAYETEVQDEHKESPVDSINRREMAQANNLYERIFKKNPRAKVVIHVGESHVTRTPVTFEDDGKKAELLWMAGRLTKLLGFPLFTIDQTGGTEASTPARESARLRGVLDGMSLKRPSLVQKADGSWLKNGNGEDCDLTVFHPRMRVRKGRPEWMFTIPDRKEVPLPPSITTPKTGRLLVQAFREDIPNDAVDIDRFLLTGNAPRPVFVLPRGRYRLQVQDEEGNVSDAGRLLV